MEEGAIMLLSNVTSIPPTGGAITEVTDMTNTTTTLPESSSSIVVIVEQVLIVFAIIAIHLGMGGATDHLELRDNLRRPWGVAAAIATQFFLMPAVAMALIYLFDLSYGYAIGTIIMASSPGGALSNVLSYWSKSDVSLSICMTTCSSAFAFVALPVLLLLFSEVFASDETIKVPFKSVAITLTMIFVPSALGVLIRYKSSRIGDVFAEVCSIAGCIGIVAFVIVMFVDSPEIINASYEAYVVSLALPLIGFSIGYFLATLLKQIPYKRRAVAIETGYQNVGLALAIFTLSYQGDPVILEMQTIPIFYGLASTLYALITIGLYKLYLRRKERDVIEEKVALLVDDDNYDETSRIKDLSYGSTSGVKDDFKESRP
ncbi:sodium-dependent organic anion transporter-like [Saccoglossus kowalevskii]|uniref:Ileal sodium/bile acid cotransporter-like n=1 Tax=Saccoglossus kowalevskii TaxID=10224 RepID=A0ABM0GJY6_SACKO|nr:PREDICTED: ileal sodium/bile acid cotransporter-like [Saccoglossus kowalevskii]